MSDPAGLRRLRQNIEHIVVLMLENRSFDHMLGYLALEGRAVDGLRTDLSNEHEGRRFPVHRLPTTDFGAPDPPHDGKSIGKQAADCGRYVETFAAQYPRSPQEWGAVMGYYTGDQLPVYDHIAREFCVCDRWFCAVRGGTFPNRVAAVAGSSRGILDNHKWFLWYILPLIGGAKSFLRHLDEREGVTWRWYSSDPATIRVIDRRYRWEADRDRFAYFDQQSEYQQRNFLDDARSGELPNMAWIDANTHLDKEVELPELQDPPGSNDDHPPHDVMLAQRLVHKLYEAVRRSDCWEKTLLIIVYDEHGGIYDHVNPPEPLGPRVPALIVSPYVGRGAVCHERLEHASIIKTILLRFADDRAIDAMGTRVRNAQDLTAVLTHDSPRRAPPVPDAGGAAVSADQLVPQFAPKLSTIEHGVRLAEKPRGKTDFQRDIEWFAFQLRTVAPPLIARLIRSLADRIIPAPLREGATERRARLMRNRTVQSLPVLRRLPPGMP